MSCISQSISRPNPITSAWERLALLRIDVVPAENLPVTLRPTMVAAEVAHIVSVLHRKISNRGLGVLKQTSNGLMLVYADPARALDVARRLRERKTSTGLRIRYGLYWGDACVGIDGSLSGGEAEMLRSILRLRPSDGERASGEDLPDRDRVLMTLGTVAQLPSTLRVQFVRIGAFRVSGYSSPIEVWGESVPVMLGRDLTRTEETFGVTGVHRDTVLDVRWAARFENKGRR